MSGVDALIAAHDDVVRDALRAVLAGDPAVVIESPPGAGKSYLVELAVSSAVLIAAERAAVATQTNSQAVDIAHRMAVAYPQMPVVLLTRKGMSTPPRLAGLANVRVVDAPADVPGGPAAIVATRAKWSSVDPGGANWEPVDLLVVDEAWQMADFAYAFIAGLAPRHLLVGDPGQIPPVVNADVRRWEDRPDGPHRPAPEALLARHRDAVTLLRLPSSRRLGAETVEMIQPSFYPQLPFGSSRPATRLVATGSPTDPTVDPVLGLATSGEMSLAVLGDGGQVRLLDREMADTIARVVRGALESTSVERGGVTVPLTPDRVAVVTAHVNQTAAVRLALSGVSGVNVDTAERHQGLEADLVVVWHPLSGRVEATRFATEAGRLCVMTSRHRAACVVVAREHVAGVIDAGPVTEGRTLGGSDPSWDGWKANDALWRRLHDGRAVTL